MRLVKCVITPHLGRKWAFGTSRPLYHHASFHLRSFNHTRGNPLAMNDSRCLLTLCFMGCILIPALAVAQDFPPQPIPIAPTASFAEAVEAHMGYVTEHALDDYGKIRTPMWLATIDIHTARLPESYLGQSGDDRRETPATSNLYLDQPTIVAAHELARRTGCKCYSDAASNYVVAYLNASRIGQHSDFELADTRSYLVVGDEMITLAARKPPHPIHTPAWESCWNITPDATSGITKSDAREATARVIRNLAMELIGSQQTAVARTDVTRRAVGLESVTWLTANNSDPTGELKSLAIKIVNMTSIVDASPGEIGVWAEALMRASCYTGESAFQQKAEQELNQWLLQHSDDRLQLPLPLAEACLSLFELKGQARHRQAAIGCARAIETSLPATMGQGANAEDYGRTIHFLIRAAEVLQEPHWRDLALDIANDAMDHLYEPKEGMFRSRIGSDRCDAIDGPGFLLLALLYLDGPDPTADSALHF
jgi:hypothetical protein